MSKTSVRKDIEKSVEEADDRDIFEKALDFSADNPVVIPAVAALLGGIGMRGAMRRQARKEGSLDQFAKNEARTAGMVAGALSGSASLPVSAYVSKNYGSKVSKGRKK